MPTPGRGHVGCLPSISMKLYMIRHAGAVDRAGWAGDDDERPLTSAGAARFFLAARGLRHIAPSVDVVMCSPLARASQTAAILSQEAGWPTADASESLGPSIGANPAF